MIAPENVQPGRWSNLKVIGDDGIFSYVCGDYENNGSSTFRIGARWNDGPNGINGIGYPNCYGNPQWFVENPRMYQQILTMLEGDAMAASRQDWLDAIYEARQKILKNNNLSSVPATTVTQ